MELYIDTLGTMDGANVEIVQEAPAFFMMDLAYITATTKHIKNSNAIIKISDEEKVNEYDVAIKLCNLNISQKFGFKLATKYSEAINNYCNSGADTNDFMAGIGAGGTIHPHMGATYYLMSLYY